MIIEVQNRLTISSPTRIFRYDFFVSFASLNISWRMDISYHCVNRFFKLFSNTAFFWPQIEGSFCNKVVLKILAPLCVLCVETHFVKANKYGQFHLLQSPDVNGRWPSFSLVYWFKLSCLSFVHCNSPLISLHWRSDDLENDVRSQEGTKNRKSFILP